MFENWRRFATDKALILLFNATRSESVFSTAGPERTEGTESISVPSEYTGEDVDVFLAFISGEGSKVANSSYLGSVTVA